MKKDYILLILRGIMIFIGIGAIIISDYYTTIWLMEFLHISLAILLSTLMILFSVGVFEVILVLRENKQFVIISMCVFLWLVVVCFSMMSTVAGQYNKRIININQNIINNSATIIDKEGYDLLIKEEKEIEEKIREKKEEKKPFISLMSDYETIEDREKDKFLYWDAYEKIKQINIDIENLNNELKLKRKEIKDYYENKKQKGETIGATDKTQIQNKSFYEWIASIFKIDSQYIEFWLSIFPAIFVDIIAPFAIAIGMFLKRKKQNETEKNIQVEKIKEFIPIIITKDDLRHFCIISWDGINKRQSRCLTNRITLLKNIKQVCPDFSIDKYNQIMKKAIRGKLIKRENNDYVPGTEFIDQEYFYKKMCELMNFA